MESMNTVNRKNVLITGANGGIGGAVAERFARSGEYDLLLNVRRQTDEFEAFCRELEGRWGCKVRVLLFDITDYDQMAAQIKALARDKLRIDALVNNAGVAHGGLFQITKLEEIRQVFEVNYFAAVRLTQLVARFMVKQRAGAIVNLASVAGIDLEQGNCAYGASKAALIAFTKTGAKELAAGGVRMNAVAPGLTDTRMAGQMKQNTGEEMVQASAMRRLGHPEEIADAIFYLASDAASFVTGQVLRVDGGM